MISICNVMGIIWRWKFFDILRNSFPKILGVLRCVFKGLGVQKGTQMPCWLRPWWTAAAKGFNRQEDAPTTELISVSACVWDPLRFQDKDWKICTCKRILQVNLDMTDNCTTDFCIWRTICLVLVWCISSMRHMYTTYFAFDGPIFLVPLSLSYPSSPVLVRKTCIIVIKVRYIYTSPIPVEFGNKPQVYWQRSTSHWLRCKQVMIMSAVGIQDVLHPVDHAKNMQDILDIALLVNTHRQIYVIWSPYVCNCLKRSAHLFFYYLVNW